MPVADNRVLVLDDEAAVCRWVARVASQCGYDVATAQELDAFLRLCDAFQPTLILLDLVLGARDGVEALRSLAASGRRARIVLMSGFDEKVLSTASRLGQALDLDIAGAVTKPLTLGDLRTLLEAQRRGGEPGVSPIAGAATIETTRNEAGALHGVLDPGALVVHYQPQCAMLDRAVAGAEALVRWRHPDRGLVPPAVFLPQAERSGFMRALTMVVLRESVAQCRGWAASGHPVPVAVNLSPVLLDDLALPDEIERVALAGGVEPSSITLEVTESAAVARRRVAMDVLTRLRLKGFRLALDDFGVGFSSLRELQHMPFTELKIDRSFVAEFGTDPTARAIVDAVIGLGHRLSMRIVAEGIETQASWALVRGAGCDVGQGFLLSPPLDAVSFERFLSASAREKRPRYRVASRS